MNILKNVVNKIAEGDKKTKLKSEKVELGLLDEFNALKKASQNFKAQSDDNIKEAGIINRNALQLISKQESIDKKLIDFESRAAKLYKQYEKAAKELGLNPKNSEAFKIYNDVLKELVSAKDVKNIKSLLTMRI